MMKYLKVNIKKYKVISLSLICFASLFCIGYGPGPFGVTNYPEREIGDLSSIESTSGKQKSPNLKVHMLNGMVYALDEWSATDGNLVSGSGQLFGINRDLIADGDFNIPIDKIAIAESNTIQNALNPLTPMMLFTATVSAMCLGGAMDCFGSCPTFYITNGDSLVLMSEGFSLSSNPVWEESDIDALYMAKPSGPDIRLRVTNEAYETHAIRRARLFAFPRSSENNRVFRTSDGDFYNSKLMYPTTCFAEEGDILSEILIFDNDERYTEADEYDLTAKEYIDLSFDENPGGDTGLVIALRQTLLSTFVYYKILDHMGSRRGYDMARLIREKKTDSKSRKRILQALGGVDVQIMDGNGNWLYAGTAYEAGPIAKDVVVVKLPPIDSDIVKIRLELTKGLWRIDQIALAQLEKKVEPLIIDPIRVEDKMGRANNDILDMLIDSEEYLTTIRGDQYDLIFQMPQGATSYEWFLESKGYYLEWHREKWLEKDNPLALAEIQWFPEKALKKMTQSFKSIEDRYEEKFWNSRYEMDINK